MPTVTELTCFRLQLAGGMGHAGFAAAAETYGTSILLCYCIKSVVSLFFMYLI